MVKEMTVKVEEKKVNAEAVVDVVVEMASTIVPLPLKLIECRLQ